MSTMRFPKIFKPVPSGAGNTSPDAPQPVAAEPTAPDAPQPVVAEPTAPGVSQAPHEPSAPEARNAPEAPAVSHAPDTPAAAAAAAESEPATTAQPPVTGPEGAAHAPGLAPAEGASVAPVPPSADVPPDAPAADNGAVVEEPTTHARSYRERAKLQRRLRYLRQTRELAFRDLGGFVFDQHRFGRSRDDIVRAKIAGLDSIDRELRTLEVALDQHQELLILQEPGISVCPRCGVIHGSDANFCPGCALPRGTSSGLPLGGSSPAAAAPPPVPPVEPPAADPYAADQPTTEFKALPPQ